MSQSDLSPDSNSSRPPSTVASASNKRKGLIAERLGVDVTGAFPVLRGYTSSHNLKLGAVAGAVIADRTATPDLLVTPALHRSPKS